MHAHCGVGFIKLCSQLNSNSTVTHDFFSLERNAGKLLAVVFSFVLSISGE